MSFLKPLLPLFRIQNGFGRKNESLSMEEVLKDERIRSEIIDAAEGLFQRYGLKKTSMEEIAEVCGKGKSTLYYYFKNKDELFYSVFDKECKSLQQELKEEVDKQEGMRNKLKTYLEVKIKKLSEFEVFHEVLLEMFMKQSEKYMEFMVGFEQFEMHLILEALIEAKEQDQLRSSAAKDLESTTFNITILLKGLFLQMLMSNNFQDFSNRLPAIVEMMLIGVLKEG